MKINTTCTNESDFKYKELKLEYEGNELHGYYFENEDKKEKTIAFLCHGYGSGAKDMVPYAKNFLEKGYEVFIPDLRGHAQSKGQYSGLGVNDVRDRRMDGINRPREYENKNYIWSIYGRYDCFKICHSAFSKPKD